MARLHNLYVANGEGLPWTADARQKLLVIVAEAFPGFTVIDAEGFFQGRPTPTLIVSIAVDDTVKVRNLAEKIRQSFDQQAVGLALDGNYERITGTMDLSSERQP